MTKNRTEEMSPQETEGNTEQQPTSESISVLSKIFLGYDRSMSAIREFSAQLTPFVCKLEKGVLKGRRKIFNKIIEDFLQSANKDELKEAHDYLDSMTKHVDGDTTTLTHNITKSKVGELMLDLFIPSIHIHPPTIYHKLLNRSILMCLVSYFEVLIGNLAHSYYRFIPEATSNNDPVLSVNELRQFKSIDDALQFVITSKVDELLRGSNSSWYKFFNTRMNIDLNKIVPDSAQWNEFFQRRHIMVHADGCVTERYLDNVDWDRIGIGVAKPVLGEELQLDDSYIEKAIDAFEIVGLLLCQEVWKKLSPEETDERYGEITGLCGAVYRRLLSGNWPVAESLAEWGIQDTDASETELLVCTLNRWLCIKRQGRWEEVLKEVKVFDTSAKHPKFALVKASLLELVDEFFEQLPAVLGAGIDIKALKEWPILEEMRSDPRFAKAIKETEQKQQ